MRSKEVNISETSRSAEVYSNLVSLLRLYCNVFREIGLSVNVFEEHRPNAYSGLSTQHPLKGIADQTGYY